MPRMVVNGNRRKTAWNDIIADLDYELPRRFSMIQIRSRIRNVLNTYRAIIAHKRKKQMTHWPLFKDVAELLKTEQLLFADSHVNPVVSEEFLRDDDTGNVFFFVSLPFSFVALRKIIAAKKWAKNEGKLKQIGLNLKEFLSQV